MGISKAVGGELQAVAHDHVQPDAPHCPGRVWLIVGRLGRAWGDFFIFILSNIPWEQTTL